MGIARTHSHRFNPRHSTREHTSRNEQAKIRNAPGTLGIGLTLLMLYVFALARPVGVGGPADTPFVMSLPSPSREKQAWLGAGFLRALKSRLWLSHREYKYCTKRPCSSLCSFFSVDVASRPFRKRVNLSFNVAVDSRRANELSAISTVLICGYDVHQNHQAALALVPLHFSNASLNAVCVQQKS